MKSRLTEDSKEVTTIISRWINQGRELEYANWFGRMAEAVKRAPGFRGISVLVPGGNSDARIILYRFADIPTMERWENSPERKELLSELNGLATQTYDKMAGVETWFHIPDKPRER